MLCILRWIYGNACLHEVEIAELLLVAWYCPFALLDHGRDSLGNTRVGTSDILARQLIEGTGLLDVGKSRLELLQLDVNLCLSLLSLGNRLGLEGLNSFNVGVDIISNGLEVRHKLLDLVNDGLVLENGSVVGKVDGGGLGGERMLQTLSLAVPLAEGLEGGDGLLSETERGVEASEIDNSRSRF